jgi:phospholipase/carboxylesterase
LGILGLVGLLPEQGLAFVAPQARNGTWYPYSFLAPLDQNEPGISSGVELIRSVVHEIEASGIPSSKILLLGFSQGGCLAIEFVARHARRFGGLAVLSGGLIGNGEIPGLAPPNDKRFEYEGDLEGTPVFLGCSDIDPHIPLSRFEQSAEVLERLGADVTSKVYPGMGHTIVEDEIDHVRRMVDQVLTS